MTPYMDFEQQKPTIQAIRLKSGDAIPLQKDSILAIVGPNNSGKSHFLNQLRAHLYGESLAIADMNEGLISSIALRWPSGETEQYLSEVAERNFARDGSYYDPKLPYDVYGSTAAMNDRYISELAAEDSRLGLFVDLFVRYDEPLSRISESERQSMENSSSALVRLYEQNEAYRAVQDDFRFIFDEEIHFHPLQGRLNFFLGPQPEKMPLVTDAYSPEAIQFLSDVATVDRQGLGMRNVLGLLLRLYTDSRSVILVDEPEAFLHPPQANRLGQVLHRVCSSQGCQVVCASHDRNFLSGLAQGNPNQLVVQRLAVRTDRDSVEYASLTVDSRAFDDVRGKSRIRYTPILESLFASVAVLVENEKDALFFESAVDYYLQSNTSGGRKSLRDSLLFIPTNGNSNFASTAELLHNLRSPTVIVGDLDLVSEPERLKKTVSAMDTGRSEQAFRLAQKIVAHFREIYSNELDGVPKNQREGKLKKKVAKHVSINHGDEQVRMLVDDLLEALKPAGVLLIPKGELEDFDRDIIDSKDKNEWARAAIDQELYKEDAVQEFCSTIVEASLNAIKAEALNTGLKGTTDGTVTKETPSGSEV